MPGEGVRGDGQDEDGGLTTGSVDGTRASQANSIRRHAAWASFTLQMLNKPAVILQWTRPQTVQTCETIGSRQSLTGFPENPGRSDTLKGVGNEAGGKVRRV